MPEYYKIKDHDNLIKNASSKAVLNVDYKGLDKYREERNRLTTLANIAEDSRRLDREVTEIKQQLAEILSLLRNKV